MEFTKNVMFDTNAFFSGGAGMFIQYHDVVKPVYLYAVFKQIIENGNYGLPINIISNLSTLSLIEWYVKRRYHNPLQSLDYMKKYESKYFDDIMLKILNDDHSLYRLTPTMHIQKMLSIYKKQFMTFPIYVYSKYYESHIIDDCKEVFKGINIKYVYGDLKQAVSKCDNNFTYMFSDIELVKEICPILKGTCSHILLTKEYRYNYIDNCNNFKYNLSKLAIENPFLRIESMMMSDIHIISKSLQNMIYNFKREDKK